MDKKKHTVVYLLGLSSIVLALAFMILPNNNNSAIAQPSSTMTPNRLQNPYFGSQNQNWTSSISIFGPILDAFKSKIHTTLNDATTNAINAVGGGTSSNSSAIAAFTHPERGFLVYDVFVLDSSNSRPWKWKGAIQPTTVIDGYDVYGASSFYGNDDGTSWYDNGS
jgi:hypothetical protein